MKVYVLLLALLVAMIVAVPVFAGEEPYVAVTNEDTNIPNYYIGEILQRFLHANTDYYAGCQDLLFPPDPRIDPNVCTFVDPGYLCPSACKEMFKTQASAIDQPEVCCDPNVTQCPAIETSLITAGNSGWYEWIIALPKKPEGELNIVIECGVLKPNSWEFFGYDAIELCAAETGEPVGPNCTRIAGGYLKPVALPKLEVIAYPGCINDFIPFHLTAYKNPSSYKVTRTKPSRYLKNSKNLQILNGSVSTRFAIKACMFETIKVKWPVTGEINALGEMEANLEAGDLIRVRMVVPLANTVDIYCNQYSVKIDGIGDPETLLNDEICDCIPDANCQL